MQETMRAEKEEISNSQSAIPPPPVLPDWKPENSSTTHPTVETIAAPSPAAESATEETAAEEETIEVEEPETAEAEEIDYRDTREVEQHYPSGFCRNLASMIEKNNFRIVGTASDKKSSEKNDSDKAGESEGEKISARNNRRNLSSSGNQLDDADEGNETKNIFLFCQPRKAASIVAKESYHQEEDYSDNWEKGEAVEESLPQQAEGTIRPESTQISISASANDPEKAKFPKWSPTILRKDDFDPRAEAMAMRTAMKNPKKSKNTIIKILAGCTNSQRHEIAEEFQVIRKRVLVEKFRSKFATPFSTLLVSMMTPFPQLYAQELCYAMKNLHRQKVAPIEIFFTLSREEIIAVKRSYNEIYGKFLEDDLRSGPHLPYGVTLEYLKANFRDKFEEASMDRRGREKKIFLKAMQKSLKKIEDKFEKAIMKSFIDFVKSVPWNEVKQVFEPPCETANSEKKTLGVNASSQLQQFFAYMCYIERDPNFFVNIEAAQDDAKKLYSDRKWKLGDDDSAFNYILASRNVSQLRQVFTEFEKISGHKIDAALEHHFSGGVDTYLMTIVHCVDDPPAFFARHLYATIESDPLDYSELFRLMVTRSEKDLVDIKDSFFRIYNITLDKFFNKIPDDDVKMCFVALLNN